jgi:hypothetical protein
MSVLSPALERLSAAHTNFSKDIYKLTSQAYTQTRTVFSSNEKGPSAVVEIYAAGL